MDYGLRVAGQGWLIRIPQQPDHFERPGFDPGHAVEACTVCNQPCTEPGFHEVARKQCFTDGHAVDEQTRDFEDGLFVRHWLGPGN